MDAESTHILVKLATAVAFIAISAGVVLHQKKHEGATALRRARRKKKEIGTVNIGAIFGMDVGGTLTKIVYFEAKRAGQGKESSSDERHLGASSLRPILAQRGSSDSLAQLDCPDHKAALENFYAFMDNNRGMAPPGTVVRDESLSLYSKFLDGKLHFLHFETRNMVDAIKYVSSTAPIEDIRSIGCTGGGAHKFAREFEEQLEITFNKFDELECLVRGMHFALNNFPDECFTYRPEDSPEGVTPGAGTGSGAESRQVSRPSSMNYSAGAHSFNTNTNTNSSTAGGAAGAEESSGGSQRVTRVTIQSPREREAAAGLSIDQDTSIAAPSPYPAPLRAARSALQQPPTQPQTPATAAATTPKSPSPQRRDGKEYTKRVLLPVSNGHGGPAFPYLVVNIGSGVSIVKVTGPGKAERVSGTSLGGGTYWGLCRLLTNCSTYEEVLDYAERGDASVVDMLVKDIYGGDYQGAKLSGSLVASSFGKLVTKEDPRHGVREEDLALALLMMITNNIGQVAYLVAQLQKCNKIFFVGNFLRQNPISCRRLAYAISFWSGGKMEAMFLVHEGHFGALGTFLTSAFGEDVDKVIGVNNIVQRVGAEAGVVVPDTNLGPGAGEDLPGGGLGGAAHKKSRSVDHIEVPPPAATDPDAGLTGVQYVDAAAASTMRKLRGRSFSDDYAARTFKERHLPLSSPLSSSPRAAAVSSAGPPGPTTSASPVTGSSTASDGIPRGTSSSDSASSVSGSETSGSGSDKDSSPSTVVVDGASEASKSSV